jgi:phosphomevalonate kinase
MPKTDKISDIAKKTGLGSSASMAVSFLGAIKRHFNLDFELHPYCQLLNAYIQEKVGSGFDIAASLFGTQLYRRFTNTGQLNSCLQNKALLPEYLSSFDYKLATLNKLPFDLVVVDVASGSDTRVMVK